ncbi:T9SS type B sorting domain-containing protein [Tenuifilum thalassicum]|uniref:T9SS type B sorting domain-containing protein n=1 Tax=Tenuifilum thalassicum TaxID=2590900 RepID=A0A7D4CQ40_9BACT|nr:gliding motility-associated C-terminal domain-containing protein [Tenuifilum thalassicum]QKG79165.1 T9SS type B sorting domain-containing protein [Tenuifilum thalassicum]
MRAIQTVIAFFTFLAGTISIHAQVVAPGRDLSLLTEYVNTTKQDSIFVFYGSTGNLSAAHSTGNPSTFKWYRYNTDSLKFKLFAEESNLSQSLKESLAEGGYRVEITDNTDSTETYTCWLFTDDVTLNNIEIDNNCEFLELNPITTPSSYNIPYDRFAYFDLSRNPNRENNTYGKQYFDNITWTSSDSRIDVSQEKQLRLVIEEPAPLYNSSYTITIVNPFGRTLSLSTPEITAIATKADDLIQVDEDGSWKDWDSNGEYEALLGLRLESKSLNCDSIYWKMTTKKIEPLGDFNYVIWRDSSLIATRNDAYPDKNIMVPGYYTIYHYSVNTSSGCIDSIITDIKVDSSKLSADIIPNVFSPNGDGINDRFVFSDTDASIRSISSFSIKIFSRSGKLVYEYSGNPHDWEGWDGKTNIGTDAAEGVYYFIIEARGWDNRKFARGPYKGFLHLFRGK